MGDWGWNGDSKRAREDFVGSSRRQEDAGEAFRYRQSSVMENIGQYVYYATKYHPIQAGSIDGTDLEPHDHAVKRALIASQTGLYDPLSDSKAIGNPQQTLFVGRLSPDTTEEELKEMFLKYGPIKSLRLVRDIVTGASRRYAFVVYEHDRDFCRAFREANGALDPHMSRVLVDYNRQRLMPGWIPRRLGGGLGGKKESGQLRFGGRDRPFHAPLKEVPTEELQQKGIPLPPVGNYFSRAQTPPLPGREFPASRDNDKRHCCRTTSRSYGKRAYEGSSPG